jgi:hypothetical protein
MRKALALAFLASFPLLAAQPRYHLELEANPAAPFPFLAKFGTVELHVFGGGVRADTIWLNAFSRNGANDVTVMNPIGRMYIDMPIPEIASMLTKLGGSRETVAYTVPLSAPVRGKVNGIDATRFRLVYGPEAWIDVWTTSVIPENAQFRRLFMEVVGAISPSAATAARNIPGTPIYVELNFSHYRKLPLVRLKSLTFDNDGESDALKVGVLYVKAPFSDAILK